MKYTHQRWWSLCGLYRGGLENGRIQCDSEVENLQGLVEVVEA